MNQNATLTALMPLAPSLGLTSRDRPRPLPSVARDRIGQADPITSNTWNNISTAITVAGTGLGAYHGYKRNNSVGWAIAWGLLGGLFPIITIPVAIAQGFGKPA